MHILKSDLELGKDFPLQIAHNLFFRTLSGSNTNNIVARRILACSAAAVGGGRGASE